MHGGRRRVRSKLSEELSGNDNAKSSIRSLRKFSQRSINTITPVGIFERNFEELGSEECHCIIQYRALLLRKLGVFRERDAELMNPNC